MPKAILLTALSIILVFAIACGSDKDGAMGTETPDTDHMVAQATLVAHYIDAALKAGMAPDEINATLAGIAGATVIDEFWVSDENGAVAFTNIAGSSFHLSHRPRRRHPGGPFCPPAAGQ